MDPYEYEELEQLFHSEARPRDFQHGGDETGQANSNLPEWLIGVIVVVILLIIVFFAMVIYSLVKERKKSRAGSYGATNSVTSPEEPEDISKGDGCIRITSFIVDNEKENTNGWVDTEAATLQRRPQGRANPVFIDDDEAKKKTEKSSVEVENATDLIKDNKSNGDELDKKDESTNPVTISKPQNNTNIKVEISAEVNTTVKPEETSMCLNDEQVLSVVENTSAVAGNRDLSTNL